MFLHKLDILNRNLNGLFQKFLLVVTKLCAVTKLGDLTVWVLDPRSGIRKKPIPDPGSRGQKGTGSRIRIRNTDCFDADLEPDPDPAQNLDADPDPDPDPGGGGGGGRSAQNVHPPWQNPRYAFSSPPGCPLSGRACLCFRHSRAAMLRTGWLSSFFGPAH